MACAAEAMVTTVRTTEELQELFKQARSTSAPIGFRGAGASYGDAALSTNRYLYDLTQMNRILAWDPNGYSGKPANQRPSSDMGLVRGRVAGTYVVPLQ